MSSATRNDAETVKEIQAHDLNIQPVFDTEHRLNTYLVTGDLVEITTEKFYDDETGEPAGTNEMTNRIHTFSAQLTPTFVALLPPEGTPARDTAISNEVKNIVRGAMQKYRDTVAAIAAKKADDVAQGRKREFTRQEVTDMLGFDKLTDADL